MEVSGAVRRLKEDSELNENINIRALQIYFDLYFNAIFLFKLCLQILELDIFSKDLLKVFIIRGRSQCPRGLKRGPADVCLLGLWGSNPAGGMDICLY